MNVTVVVGNPKPASRTLHAATALAARLTGQPPQTTIDLIELGAGLLGFGDAAVGEAVAALAASDVAIIASPTYKGSYTGLLKCFLDQIARDALAGVLAFPVMLGADWRHSLAPEAFLKPVLAELGAACPTRGLYLLDSDFEDPDGLDAWLDDARTWLTVQRAARRAGSG